LGGGIDMQCAAPAIQIFFKQPFTVGASLSQLPAFDHPFDLDDL